MKLHDTLSRQSTELAPLQDITVKIYTCGLTVYSQPHIGNWLGYIYWDILIRTLKFNGYNVERTQNITDVGHLTSDDDNGEDKMEKGARREGITAWDIAEKYIRIADEESKQLGLLPPDHLVRATSMIDEQIAFAKVLDEKGYLYEIPGDGMYFDTGKLEDYGKLARLDISGLEAGARVSVEGKRNITDFAVWKFSPVDSKRDMEWDSPWGTGFPGWHLECSVIARETLGDQIDIHTGGIDHIPVHHTNEIAQTEAVTGKQFAQIWLHNNHLKADGQKMSKSLGNIYTLQDIVNKGYTIDAFKLFSLGKHYTTEGNFTWDNLEAAAARLKSFEEFADLQFQIPIEAIKDSLLDAISVRDNLVNVLNDDLNTAEALNVISKFIDDVKSDPSKLLYEDFIALLTTVDELLGLHLSERENITSDQKELIVNREQAREAKDWQKSDDLREQLKEQGIALRDTPNGSIWFKL